MRNLRYKFIMQLRVQINRQSFQLFDKPIQLLFVCFVQFDVFAEIRVTPLEILLSQKIFTAVNRKRPKGRDFYDITYLSSRTKPDLGFLNKKLGINTGEGLRKEISARIAEYDFKDLADDVAPFLMNRYER